MTNAPRAEPDQDSGAVVRSIRTGTGSSQPAVVVPLPRRPRVAIIEHEF
ncbi:hypothetical protein [Saccharopolyspora kobensis]